MRRGGGGYGGITEGGWGGGGRKVLPKKMEAGLGLDLSHQTERSH